MQTFLPSYPWEEYWSAANSCQGDHDIMDYSLGRINPDLSIKTEQMSVAVPE
jgi:hypothetical protein